MVDFAFLGAEIANNMYKKPLEAIAREIHYDPLPESVVFIQSLKNFSMLLPAAVKKMVTAQEQPAPTAV